MALRLRERGWKVLGLDKGDDFPRVRKLPIPRVIILSVPHQSVDSIGKNIIKFLTRGDILVDAGNSFYKDTSSRAIEFLKRGIKFIDMGISGGPAGARSGASLMIGGDEKTFNFLKPLFRDLAVKNGVQFFPGAGAGHFVKMVHNGIEYGMMQSLAEGFTILKKSEYKINLKKAARIYNNGSVIESRLVEWLLRALEKHGQDFNRVSGKVGATGEGAWTVKTAKESKIKVKVLEDALKFRIKSQKYPDWTGKLLSALRGEFGGHKVK